MTLDQFERLEAILNALEPELKNMGGKSPEFVRDQFTRVEQYGADVRISPKQMKWLEELYQKHVGSLDGLNSEATRDEVLGDEDDDMDDEIPY